MQAEVLKAQAATLEEWAASIDHDDRAPEGAGEVSFLLRRAARMMKAIATGTALPPPFERVPPAEVTEPRAG